MTTGNFRAVEVAGAGLAEVENILDIEKSLISDTI